MLILIVEDDPDTQKIYRDFLESRGYEVVTASQGAEGVALARKISPDLILMDIRMPIMDGTRAMEYLKADRETARIPIFGISAFGAPDQPQGDAGKLNFDQFLVKPLEMRSVLAAIQERIGPPRTRAPEAETPASPER